jgi:hypothetical protein
MSGFDLDLEREFNSSKDCAEMCLNSAPIFSPSDGQPAKITITQSSIGLSADLVAKHCQSTQRTRFHVFVSVTMCTLLAD